MAQEFRLPDIGEGLTDAEIVRWLVAVGDRVEVDQPVVELETAKSVVEVTSPFAGVVLHRGGEEGATVLVGAVLLVVGEPGERWSGAEEAGSDAAAAAAAGPEAAAVPTPPPSPPARVRAMPLVRRLAAAHDIDLRDVAGSGPAGAVTRRDVEQAIAARAAAPRAAAAPSDDGERRVRLPRIRRTIAAHLSRSWREIPHVTVFADVDAGVLLRTRRLLEERRDRPLPLEALLVAAVVPLLEEFPEFNAFVDGDDVVYRSRRDVGIAVDTPDGLIVPVLRGADTLRLDELADRILELVSLAGSRRIPPEDASGQTFTVSNIGALGGGHGTPIIPSGTAAILSVGRAREAPAVRDGAVVVAPLMPVSLSFDHRLIDGGLGQRFLAALEANLTEPLRFLVP